MASLLAALCGIAFSDSVVLDISGMVNSSVVNGVSVGSGNYTLQQLTSAGSAVGLVSSGGQSGIPLWSLLGGNAAGVSDVVTSTPDGYNGKNAILRSYVLATTASGAQSIISLGEIDPFFGGTGTTPDFIAPAGIDGKPELVFPGSNASGRNVADLRSLQILAAPALPAGPGGISSSLTLSGNVSHPGNYALSDLQALPATTVTIKGDTYTGVSLWGLVGSGTGNVFDQYVLASGTDGYEALYSLAEIDPDLGAPTDLVPYADDQGQFPSDGFARVVIPGDNHAGRYISNLNSLEVGSVPEPGTMVLVSLPLLAFCLVFKAKKTLAAAVSISDD